MASHLLALTSVQYQLWPYRILDTVSLCLVISAMYTYRKLTQCQRIERRLNGFGEQWC
jgi:hypothetical protein